MLLTDVRDEFSFHCQCRKLAPRTIKNYTKQIDYLLRFLQQEKQTTHGALDLRRVPQGPALVASGKASPHASSSGACRNSSPADAGAGRTGI